MLYYHSSPTPYGFDQLRALPPNKTIESSLRIGNVPEPIYHERNATSVNVWGQLNLKDRATVRVCGGGRGEGNRRGSRGVKWSAATFVCLRVGGGGSEM